MKLQNEPCNEIRSYEHFVVKEKLDSLERDVSKCKINIFHKLIIYAIERAHYAIEGLKERLPYSKI